MVTGFQTGQFGDERPSDPVFATLDEARDWAYDHACKDEHVPFAVWRMPEAELLFLFLRGYEFTPE